ncbi:rhodanese-like domain-containing protein [Aurantimonas marina]|uniref:rhodanese-like domain-containing protein n=1 Tax=Aurantimonas marina TaxID=2780508 RepID=UPI0019D2E6DB|nr:rhodanese-like domain-containing protein [Aurantimonas marina]
MIRTITAQAAKTLVHSGDEIAFLDIREAGQFCEGHPLFAAPCTYSRLEREAARLVPRRDVPVLLIDAGDGVAVVAAHHLSALGYTDLNLVAGGAPGWLQAGFTLFKGVNVPSKTLGELAEHEWRPDVVAPQTLVAWHGAGNVALFDARPPAEFRKMHVPGAVCLPNGELAHRVAALELPEDKPVVISCAGRTRGIVGAIGLRLTGHVGPVYALENGTQGWALAGHDLVRGVTATAFPSLDEASRAAGRERAESFLERWRIPVVSSADVQSLLADPARTTFAFDVRSEAEALADPLAFAPHAPSGQLVQATDQYVGVRHARLVLCDDLGIRAGLAAFWLRQLGFEPVIALIDDALRALEQDGAPKPSTAVSPKFVEARAALDATGSGRALLIDLRSSLAYRESHAEGAVWATRSNLSGTVARDRRQILLIVDDDAVLIGAARDLDALARSDFAVVAGGHAALLDAGAKKAASPSIPSDAEAIDFARFVHDRHDGNLDASRRYLAWEMGLVGQLDEAERNEFQLSPARPP